MERNNKKFNSPELTIEKFVILICYYKKASN
jgi:hypothetical protein